MEGEFQIPPTSLFPLFIPLHNDKATMTGLYSTGGYPFPFHRKNRDEGAPVVLRQSKLILFPCGETGLSQTSSSRLAIGQAREEAASPSMEVRMIQFAWFQTSAFTRDPSPQNHSKMRYTRD